jgi:hypothetical protein
VVRRLSRAIKSLGRLPLHTMYVGREAGVMNLKSKKATDN